MKPSLSKLAEIANTAHVAGERVSLKRIEHFRRAGEALIAAKEQCGHGKWLEWLEENIRFSQRQANSYMRLAKLEVTSNLPDQWRAILGNDRDEGGQHQPGPFLPSEQQQQILDWLIRRRESWPEKFRAGFVPFVQHALNLMVEEDCANDGRQGIDCAAAEAGAA